VTDGNEAGSQHRTAQDKPALGLVLPIGPTPGTASQLVAHSDALIDAVEPHVHDLWVTDHLQWDDQPTLEAWTTLSFAAARWPHLNIGTVVLAQSYRNAGLLSKMATTLQVLSGGRLIFGIGAGWKRDEYDAYDYPFPSGGTRVDELRETLELLDASWRESGPITYDGAHHRLASAYLEPRPQPRPPILVGGGGDKTLRLVARHADWWNLPDCSADTYADRLGELRRAGDEEGRNPAEIRLGWFGRLAVAATMDDALALSAGRWTPDNALVGTIDDVAAQLGAFTALGVDHFAVEVLVADPQAPGAATEAISAIRTLFRSR